MAGKKITQLNSGSVSNLPLSGVTAVVYSGTTFQHSLSGLRQILVDSGSHYFSGSQTINGNLTISGSITAQEYILSSSITNITTETISGSSNFGNSSDDNHNFTGSVKISGSLYLNNSEVSISGSGSHLAFYNGPKSLTWNDNFHIIENGNTLAVGLDITSVAGGDPEYRERLIVGGDTSHNIATFQEANGNHYAAINIINYNSGSNASADLVIGNDQNAESSSYVNLGINSSTHANLSCGYAGDAYLVNWGNDMYVGSMEIAGISGHGHTHLFSAGAWRNPGISMYNDTTIGFFTEKQNNQRFSIPSSSQGFRVEFSGSVKMDNNLKVDGWVSGSHFVGDGSQLTNLPSQITDVSMFLSSSTFNSFTSSYNDTSASFDSRIVAATNEQNLSHLATTGSNTFVDNQIISGSKYLAVETIQNLSGSLNLITDGDSVQILGSNLNVLNGGIITNFNVSASAFTGSLDWLYLINVPSLVSSSSQISYSGLTGIPSGIVSGSSQILDGSGIWSGSAQLPSGIISGSSQLPSGLVSGSSQISYTGITDTPIGKLASFYKGYRNGSQTGVNTNTEVLFNSTENSYGSDISLNTTTGEITLSANKTYRLRGLINQVTFSGSEGGHIVYQWYNKTSSTYVGRSGTLRAFGSSTEYTYYNGGPVESVITTTGTTILSLKIVSSIKDANPGINITLDGSSIWFDVETIGGNSPLTETVNYEDIVNKPSGIISGSSQISDLGYAITGSNTFIGDQTINGSLIIEGVSEVIAVDGGFNGNRTFDYTSGSIFYLTGLTGNGVWNIENVPTTNNKALALTYVIEQGVTAYSGSQYQINGSNVTVKWVDNTIPTGSANNTEVIGLTAFRVGSSWNVIGSLSTFGV